MDKALKEELTESLAEVFHEAWMHWAGAVKSEVSAERGSLWDECMVPYDQLDESTKDLDRKWAKDAMEAIEPSLKESGGPVKEMVTKVQIDASKYPQLSKFLKG